MAQANNGEETMISGINVTPLVDVVLVLLVVLMVTATYIASRTIPVDLPKGATGEATNVVLAITIDVNGELFLDGARAGEPELRAQVRKARARELNSRSVTVMRSCCRRWSSHDSTMKDST